MQLWNKIANKLLKQDEKSTRLKSFTPNLEHFKAVFGNLDNTELEHNQYKNAADSAQKLVTNEYKFWMRKQDPTNRIIVIEGEIRFIKLAIQQIERKTYLPETLKRLNSLIKKYS